MTVDALDDDDLLVRSLQGVPSPFPFEPIRPIPSPGHSPLSSISAAEKTEVPKHRPTLSSPNVNVMAPLIALHLETERLEGKAAAAFRQDITESLDKMDRLNAEKQEALEKEAKAMKARDTWTVLGHVSQYVAGASAIIFGAATLAIAPAAGWLLIASGGLGLANRVLHDTPLLETIVAWKTESEELQKKYTHQIEMGLFYLQMGLGLAGGIWAWQAGAFAAAQATTTQAALQKATSIVATASGVMSVGSQVGVAVQNKKRADMEALIHRLSGQITTEQQTIYQNISEINRAIEGGQSQVEELRQLIQTLQISFD